MNISKQSKGFTLIELLIAITIVAILAAVAVPLYLKHRAEAMMSELLNIAQGIKPIVADCMQKVPTSDIMTKCVNGQNGIPTYGSAAASGTTIQISTVSPGSIVVEKNLDGDLLTSEAVILTPTMDADGFITWSVSCSSASLATFC